MSIIIPANVYILLMAVIMTLAVITICSIATSFYVFLVRTFGLGLHPLARSFRHENNRELLVFFSILITALVIMSVAYLYESYFIIAATFIALSCYITKELSAEPS